MKVQTNQFGAVITATRCMNICTNYSTWISNSDAAKPVIQASGTTNATNHNGNPDLGTVA